MNEGICHGGPMDGERLASRFPKGVLLVDKPAGECWIYESRDGEFVARDETPMPVHTDGPVNRHRAAAEANYDVVAAPWVEAEARGVAGGDPGQ